MRGVFIVNDQSVLLGQGGIAGKIRNQVKVLNKNGLNCSLCVLEPGISRSDTLKSKFLYSLPFSNILPRWKVSKQLVDADYIYFRRPLCITHSLLRFLKRLKKQGTKIILEIPTFPYDKEFDSIALKVVLFRDRLNRRRLKKYVDLITYLGDKQPSGYIWGVKSIQLKNGIDCSSIRIITPKRHNSINLICVSSCEYWHGYERLIKGLYNYQHSTNSIKVFIHVVGEGPELQKYCDEVTRFGLEQYVFFHGKLYGEELDSLYDEMDVSIGCLGFHRKNMIVSSELKSRESFAKGLPFAASCDIDVFLDYPTEYFLKLESGEEPISIDSIVDFYNYLATKGSKEQVISEIRDYAESHFDIMNQFLPVVSFIKEGLL